MTLSRVHILRGVTTIALVIASCCVTRSADAAQSGPARVTSSAQLEYQLEVALRATTLTRPIYPSSTASPKYSDLYSGASYLRTSCNPFVYPNQAKSPKPCWYGDLKAKKLIVIFGNSSVGNWIPALDLAGKSLGYRVASFSFLGCSPAYGWNGIAGPLWTATLVNACDTWHKVLPGVINSLHPDVLMVSEIGTSHSGGSATEQPYIDALKQEVLPMTAGLPGLRGIIIQAAPIFPQFVPSCVMAHPGNLQACTMSYTPGLRGNGLYSAAMMKDQAAATALNFSLLDTNSFFCVHNRCPAFVNHIFVMADADHTTVQYSLYWSLLFQAKLKSILTSSSTPKA